jgi:tetratricopeptide (TPR) repeat protein
VIAIAIAMAAARERGSGAGTPGVESAPAMSKRLEFLEQLVAKSPSDPMPYYGLALEYRSAGRDDDALRAFETVRARFPTYVPQYLMAGQLCQKLGRLDAAREWLNAGIAVARDARDAHALGELESALAGVS